MANLIVKFVAYATFLGNCNGGGGPSDNPIGTTPPNFPGGSIANDAPPGPFLRDFSPPFPTDSWWSGFTVSEQSANVAGPFPYQSATTNTGLAFGIGQTREFDGVSIKVPVQHEWNVGFMGLPESMDNRKATAWDTQVVCLRYEGGESSMDSCLVQGSPYMTFEFENAQIRMVSLAGDITSFEWADEGAKAKVSLGNGVTYIVYIIAGSANLVADATTITSDVPTTATLRMAKLVDPAHESILDAYVNTYATGVDMRYTVQGDSSTVTWTYETVGDANNLLILSWPHHRKVLQNPQTVEISILTLKGTMEGIQGNVWTMNYNLPTISWFPEHDVHSSCMDELVKTLEADVGALEEMVPGDFYFWGGSFGRASRLALIAEHIGRQDLITSVVEVLKASINHWFDPAHVPAGAYETGWGGFINKEGWNNTWVDFGNGYYNDHHFHYGYFLQGAATIGKYDSAWLNEHLDFLTHVARNIGNPSPNDPHYTVTRHMDWFHGHSWASGIANGAGARDQESSGEAINGYYGLLLFAQVTNNLELVDYARLLLSIEVLGAQTYWHLYPKAGENETPFPEQEFRNLITVGNVEDWQIGAWLFWGDQKIQIAAIQILPLTPIGNFNYDPEWMEEVVPYCQEELDDVNYGDDFKSVIYAAYAKVSPQEAYTYSTRLSSWGSGNSASNQLYFVATQQSDTDICSASQQTPEGSFVIQDADSGLYVTVSGDGQLSASASVDVLATKLNLGFVPGGGSIQSTTNNLFVTASVDGQAPLSASRETVGSYEVFRWAEQPDGTYHLTAMVNKHEVTTREEDNGLINNSNSTNGIPPGKFRLIPFNDSTPIDLPAEGVLQSFQNQRYVIATAGDPILKTTESDSGSATQWAFEKIEDSSTSYAIQNVETGMYVTGNMDGSVPLSATVPTPQSWEHFQFVPYQDSYILLHVVSGKPISVQPDDTLMDSSDEVNDSSLWVIV